MQSSLIVARIVLPLGANESDHRRAPVAGGHSIKLPGRSLRNGVYPHMLTASRVGIRCPVLFRSGGKMGRPTGFEPVSDNLPSLISLLIPRGLGKDARLPIPPRAVMDFAYLGAGEELRIRASCAASIASEHRPRREVSAEHQQSAEEGAPKGLLAEPAAHRAASRHAEKGGRERGG